LHADSWRRRLARAHTHTHSHSHTTFHPTQNAPYIACPPLAQIATATVCTYKCFIFCLQNAAAAAPQSVSPARAHGRPLVQSAHHPERVLRVTALSASRPARALFSRQRPNLRRPLMVSRRNEMNMLHVDMRSRSISRRRGESTVFSSIAELNALILICARLLHDETQ
jgi:hypothetical protein